MAFKGLGLRAMKILLLTNHNSYPGREYMCEMIKAGINFDVVSIGCGPEKNGLEDKRCQNRWQPESFSLLVSKCDHLESCPSLECTDLEDFLSRNNYDLGIQGGCGILKKKIIGKFRIGIINFHPGDLPEYRGCSAPEYQILEGKPVVCTCHIIDEGIDSGPIYKKKELDLDLSSYSKMRAGVYKEISKYLITIVHEIIENKGFESQPCQQASHGPPCRKYIGDKRILELIEIMGP